METFWAAHCDGDVYWKTKRAVKIKKFGDLMPCSLVDSTIASVNVLLTILGTLSASYNGLLKERYKGA
jgi:hypothetical protein